MYVCIMILVYQFYFTSILLHLKIIIAATEADSESLKSLYKVIKQTICGRPTEEVQVPRIPKNLENFDHHN